MSEPIRRPISEENKPRREKRGSRGGSKKKRGVDTVQLGGGGKAPSRSRRRRKRWTVRSWLTLIGVGLIFVLIIGAIAGYVFVRRYLQSEAFHAEVSKQTGGALRADSSVFAPFEWENLTMSTDNYKAHGGGESFFDEIELRTVRTEISLEGVKRGVWVIPSVRADWMKIDFIKDAESAAERASETTGSMERGVEVVDEDGAPLRWPMSMLPNTVELETIDVRSANLRFPLGNDREARALGMGAVGERLKDEKGYQFKVSGGQLAVLPFFGAGEEEGALDIKHGTIELREGDLFVNDLELSGNGNPARVGVQGYFIKSPVVEGARELRFETTVEQLPIAELLGAEWANRLVGTFNGEILTERGPSQKMVTNSGRIWLHDARLETSTAAEPEGEGLLGAVGGLATRSGFGELFGGMVPMLGAYTENRARFRSILFDKARLRFAQRGERIEVREIYFYSSGLIAVEGDVNIDGEKLNGLVQVGVAPSVLAGIPGAESEVFTQNRAGMRWTPVQITGTLDDPQEDLSARLIQAAGGRILEIVPDSGKAVIKGTQRVIEGGVPLLKNAGDAALRSGAEILEKGGSSLFKFLQGSDEEPEGGETDDGDESNTDSDTDADGDTAPQEEEPESGRGGIFKGIFR